MWSLQILKSGQYLYSHSRPELTFAVSQVARFVDCSRNYQSTFEHNSQGSSHLLSQTFWIFIVVWLHTLQDYSLKKTSKILRVLRVELVLLFVLRTVLWSCKQVADRHCEIDN